MTHSLQFQDYPAHVAQIIQAAIKAVDPAAAVTRHLQRDGRSLAIGPEIYNLEQGRVFLISIGKAAVPMGLAAAAILGDTLASAIFVAKQTARDWNQEIEASAVSFQPSTFSLYLSGHPVPNEESVQAGTAVLNLLAQTTTDDLVLFLISGGASALIAQPLLPLNEWQQLTDALLASGCTINELNRVRRQLDRVKGGGLASAVAAAAEPNVAPAACASLIMSDVIGNDLAAIGSGPTVFMDELPAVALAVLNRYGMVEKLGTAVWQTLITILTTENDQPRPRPDRNQHLIVSDIRQAADAAMTQAAQLGFIAQILTTKLEGEAREAGRFAAALAKDAPANRCLILGGETTVTLRGQGKGGRNQELALSAAIALEGWPNRVIFSLATDGEDGPTDAAGGIVTGETAVIARRQQLNPITYLDQNNSYTFFQKLEQDPHLNPPPLGEETNVPLPSEGVREGQGQRHHIQTGSTGTNVNDLLIILTYSQSIRNAK